MHKLLKIYFKKYFIIECRVNLNFAENSNKDNHNSFKKCFQFVCKLLILTQYVQKNLTWSCLSNSIWCRANISATLMTIHVLDNVKRWANFFFAWNEWKHIIWAFVKKTSNGEVCKLFRTYLLSRSFSQAHTNTFHT